MHTAAPGELNRLAASATNHCLTGCVIGEVTGMTIATALGWGDVASIALAVALAFLFGYGLTSLPLLRAGLAVAAIVPIALAADTVSIAIMEAIDNGFMLLVPGAMAAGLGDLRVWAPLLGGVVIAWPVAFMVNRAAGGRGKGRAAAREHPAHGETGHGRRSAGVGPTSGRGGRMTGLMARASTGVRAKLSKMLDRAEDPSETLDYSDERQLQLLQDVK